MVIELVCLYSLVCHLVDLQFTVDLLCVVGYVSKLVFLHSCKNL